MKSPNFPRGGQFFTCRLLLSHNGIASATQMSYNKENNCSREDGLQKTTRLRDLRERAALSQEDLAKRAGVSRATIADLEASKRPARPSTRRKLAEALRVAPHEL